MSCYKFCKPQFFWASVSCYALLGSIVIICFRWQTNLAAENHGQSAGGSASQSTQSRRRHKMSSSTWQQPGRQRTRCKKGFIELLLNYNKQLLSLQEKEIIFLHRQTSSKPCLQLVFTGFLCSHHVAFHSVYRKFRQISIWLDSYIGAIALTKKTLL